MLSLTIKYLLIICQIGHYIPQLSRLVYERNVKGVQSPDINLKGLMVSLTRIYIYSNSRCVGRPLLHIEVCDSFMCAKITIFV
mgnify:CR=1 FL=1